MAVKKSSAFDRIAFAYDFLARLVFGNSIKDAQCVFLDQIPSGSRVLIIGGGTGWIIPKLFQAVDIRELVYLEASEQMIRLSKSKNKDNPLVTFIQGTEQDLSALGKFDVVLTFFFLDLFPPASYTMLGSTIHQSLNTGGLWVISDFKYGLQKRWQRLLLRSMYVFFKLICRIPAKQLGDIKNIPLALHMQKLSEITFFHEMIFSTVYKNDTLSKQVN
ncbi:MAG: class SAM-dependent methyltransferase [Chitinophagaceae bacterium]|nr:class SAM-dependent methyltransferase [Chitinophagaceae bacterium]